MGDQMLDYDQIGQQIRKARRAQGLSQEQLAEKVDISVTHMSHIETGATKLSLPVLVALAEALGVSTDEILFPEREAAVLDARKSVQAILQTCTPKQTSLILAIARAVMQAG